MRSVEVHLYGQAEAIRVLYQTASQKERPPKPPRPKRQRGLWIGRYVDSLRSSLSEPVGTGSLERVRIAPTRFGAGDVPAAALQQEAALFLWRGPD